MLSDVCRCVSDYYPTHPWKPHSVSTITQTPHLPPGPIFHSIYQKFSSQFLQITTKVSSWASASMWSDKRRQCIFLFVLATVDTKWQAFPVETIVPLVRRPPGLRSAASKHFNEQKGHWWKGVSQLEIYTTICFTSLLFQAEIWPNNEQPSCHPTLITNLNFLRGQWQAPLRQPPQHVIHLQP